MCSPDTGRFPRYVLGEFNFQMRHVRLGEMLCLTRWNYNEVRMEVNMNTWSVAEYILLVLLVVFAAWEPRGLRLKNALRWLRFKTMSRFYVLVWIFPATVFWWFFWVKSEHWQLLGLLTEIAGVTYLAREVNIAQTFEGLRHTLCKLIELESLVDQKKYKEYLIEYFKIDGGKPMYTADYLDSVGVIEQEVVDLKIATRQSFDRLYGETADLTFTYRRNRLLRGLALVVLGLSGHGLHMLAY